LDQDSLQTIYERGLKDGENASFVLYDQDKLIGFRLSFAPE
jgi:hypothetical protein